MNTHNVGVLICRLYLRQFVRTMVRISSLNKDLRTLHTERNNFIKFIYSLEKRLISKEISIYQKDFYIKSVTKGLSDKDYLNSLNSKINILENEISHKKHSLEHSKTVIAATITVFLIFSMFLIANKQLTHHKTPIQGLLVYDDAKEIIVPVNKNFDPETITTYALNFNENAILTSFKISGVYTGNFRAYLVKTSNETGNSTKYLIYDTSLTKNNNVITGDRKSTRLNSSHVSESRMPSSA